MKNSKTKGIIKLFAVIICLISLGGGVFSTVCASKATTEYNAQMEIVNNFEEKFNEKTGKYTNNPILGAKIRRNESEKKANEAKIEAETQKNRKEKFTFLSIVLYIVCAMMLICTIVLSRKNKKASE